MLLLLMNTFIFRKLLCCSTVWSSTSKHNIDKLQKVQNFAGRIVIGLKKYDHISDGLRSLNWLPIKHRLKLNEQLWRSSTLTTLSRATLQISLSYDPTSTIDKLDRLTP